MSRLPNRQSPSRSVLRRLPPLVALVRGGIHQGRLSFAGRFGHLPRVQRRIAERSLNALDRWCAPAEDPAADLHRAERSLWSQNGEDGLLAELLRRAGTPTRTFVEIGASDGTENCTRALAEKGWKGVWLEADDERVERARVLAPRVAVDVRQAIVTSRNVGSLLSDAGVPTEPDVAVLDIDGSDFWVMRSLLRQFAPRVLVVEYNASFPPGVFWTRRNRASYVWDETYRHGASLDAMAWAAGRFGYQLVACDQAGVNAFLVRGDIASELQIAEHPLASLYRPLVIAPPTIGHPSHAESPCPELAVDEQRRVRLAGASVAFRRPLSGTQGGQLVGVRVVIDNASQKRLTSRGPTPLRLSAHILDASGTVIEWEGDRSWVHGGVPAGGRATAAGLFRVKDSRAYILRLCLVQENVAWMDHGAIDVAIA